MKQSVGVGKGTVTLDDFNECDLILVIGQNPGTNHPRMLSSLQAARERGAKVVAVNPLRERGLVEFLHPQRLGAMLTNQATAIATHYYQPLIGGDLALLTGLIKAVCEAEELSPGDIFDHDFIKEHTEGLESVVEKVAVDDWQTIEKESGLERAQIEELATLYIKSDKVIACWAMGLTQHRHAVPTLQQLSNLMLLRGMVGKPGAGLCPVRGHSNVQGDRTMGIYEKPAAAFLDALDQHYGMESPREHGYDVVAAIEAMQAAKVDVFFAMGGNFAQATPDSAYTAQALQKCQLTVQVSTKLNRSHLIHGTDAIILPCLAAARLINSERGLNR